MSTLITIALIFLANEAFSRDYSLGAFFKNDDLVANDRLYKEIRPWRYATVNYGRRLKCPMTYFRVADRLGVGTGVKTRIIRGGLRHKFIVARMTSSYNMPISVNILIGCTHKTTTTISTLRVSSEAAADETTTMSGNTTGGGENTTDAAGGDKNENATGATGATDAVTDSAAATTVG